MNRILRFLLKAVLMIIVGILLCFPIVRKIVGTIILALATLLFAIITIIYLIDAKFIPASIFAIITAGLISGIANLLPIWF